MIKILSKKKYNHLIVENERLIKENSIIQQDVMDLQRRIDDKKTSCKINNGKAFCFSCANSYKRKVYWGATEHEVVGCLLEVSCEKFSLKE